MSRTAQSVRDEILILRCQRGEAQALADFVRQWEGRLFYYVRRLVPQEADAWDVLQKSWVQVVRDIRRLRDPAALRPWLYRLVRNTAISHYRAALTRQATAEFDGDIEDTSANDEVVRTEDAEEVHHALGLLPLPAREVLTLHFLEGMSVEEMAGILDVPIGTVKSRMHHAKHALRQLLTAKKESRS